MGEKISKKKFHFVWKKVSRNYFSIKLKEKVPEIMQEKCLAQQCFEMTDLGCNRYCTRWEVLGSPRRDL